MLGTIFHSGLRPSETLGLEPEDADLEDEENAWFHLRGAKPGGIASRWFDPGEDRRTGVKGLARTDAGRSVPIDPMWARHLQRVLKQCPPQNGILFSTENGTSPTPSNLNRALTSAKRSALPPLVPARPGTDLMIPNPLLKTTPYDLRHARASLWLKKFDPTQVAAFMGHSTDVLLRIYANCVGGDLSLALAAIKARSVDRPFPSRRGSVPHLSHSTPEVGSAAIQSVA